MGAVPKVLPQALCAGCLTAFEPRSRAIMLAPNKIANIGSVVPGEWCAKYN